MSLESHPSWLRWLTSSWWGLGLLLILLASVLLVIVLQLLTSVEGDAAASPDEILVAAVADLERNQPARAARALRQFDRDGGLDAHRRLLSVILQVRSGSAEAALQSLQALEVSEPLRPVAQLYAARALHSLNRFVEAEFLLRGLVAQQPSNAEVRRWLGIVYYDLGAQSAAVEQLQKLAELDTDDFRPHRLLGLMHTDFEQFDLAIKDYRNSLSLSPPPEIDLEIRQELGSALVSERRYDEANDVLQSVTPTAKTLALQARCAWSTGRTDEALARLKDSRSLDAGDRSALLLEAEIRGSQGNHAAELKLLATAVHGNPYDAQCRYSYGMALRDSGRTDEAAAELEAWSRLKTEATRLTDLNLQAIAEPFNAEIRDELAEVCALLGKTELAEMWRKTAAACRSAAQRGTSQQQTP